MQSVHSHLNRLWNGVVSAATPRITGKHALEGQPGAFERTVFPDGLNTVVGTCRGVATASANTRGKGYLVKPDQSYQEI